MMSIFTSHGAVPWCAFTLLCLFRSVFAASFQDTIPDVTMAHELMFLSKLIYSVQSVSDSIIPSDIHVHFYTDDVEGTEVLVATSSINDGEDYLAVVYRGSDEAIDWNRNTNFVLDKYPSTPGLPSSVRVHSGFKQAVFDNGLSTTVEAKILELLASPNYNFGGKVYMTGHSLGGANAQLLATDFASRYTDVSIITISFGAPRVGNNAYKNWVNSISNLSVWQFVRGEDWVARLPYEFIAYKHAGHFVQLDDSSAKAYYSESAVNIYSGFPDDWNYGFSISDHYPARYLEYLSKSMSDPATYYVSEFELKST